MVIKPLVNILYDYCAFGSEMPNRSFSSGEYRYGFNGQEKDDEVSGSGNSYTAEFWQYDSRLGRRWNIDPEFKRVPSWTPYHINFMSPIWFSDPDGDDPCSGGDRDKKSCKSGANANNKKTADRGGFGGRRQNKPKLAKVNSEQLTTFGFGKPFGIFKTNKPKSKETKTSFKEGTITLEATSNIDEGDGGDRFRVIAGKGKNEEVLFDEVLDPQDAGENLSTETFKIDFKLDKSKKIRLEVTNDKNKTKSPSAFFGKLKVKKK